MAAGTVGNRNSSGYQQNGFWNTEFWLPPGVEWDDLEGDGYRKMSDLLVPIPLAFVLLLLRFLLDRLVFHPVGQYFGIRKSLKRKIAEPNDILETAFTSKNKKLDSKDISKLAKDTKLEVRQVERWLRKRKLQDKPTTLDKFSECGWRFFAYASASLLGFYVVWNEPWFKDLQYCWIDYPKHQVSRPQWWHCMLSQAFYWSLTISQFWDAKRSDFWEMFVHHVASLLLMALSWTTNFVRIFSLILLVHDVADPFLELAKMTKYANLGSICWVIFGMFTFMFLITRMYFYPMYIIYNILGDRREIVPDFPLFYIILSMLLLLLCLHIFWTVLLFKAIYRAAFSSKLEDIRSSSESCLDTSDGAGEKKRD